MPATHNRPRRPLTAALALITSTVFIVTGCGQEDDSPKPVAFKQVDRVAEAERCDSGLGNRYRAPRGDDCLILTDDGALKEVMVESARVAPASTGPGWTVNIDLSPKDAKAFAELTDQVTAGSADNKRIAVLIDQELVSAPEVNSPIESGKLRLSVLGREKAEQLVTDLTGEEPREDTGTNTVEPWAPPEDPY